MTPRRKSAFTWQQIVIPVAATIITALIISGFVSFNSHVTVHQLAEEAMQRRRADDRIGDDITKIAVTVGRIEETVTWLRKKEER